MYTPSGFEERTISWTLNELEYSIQIYPIIKNDRIKKWVFDATCWTDINGWRHLKKKRIFENRRKTAVISDFSTLSKQALTFLNGLNFEDLNPIVAVK